MHRLAEAEHRLVAAMNGAARGPRQNGVFALWLAVRLCGGFLLAQPPKERYLRERLRNAQRRLSSLSMPAPLRRALTGALRELEARGAVSAPIALQQLVAPARETLGTDPGEAMALAARQARAALRALGPVTVQT